MGLTHAIVAAVLLAAVMTFGDYIWSVFNVRHKVLNGILHGAAMCLVLGAVIGWRARRVPVGAVGGLVIGVIAALAFYALAGVMRYWAMLPAWMLFWILFAILQQRLTRTEGTATALGRGVAAALVSGAAFYAISGIWISPPPGPPRYGVHFASWVFAFLPGFIALFIGARAGRQR
jgi:hypothetical protein